MMNRWKFAAEFRRIAGASLLALAIVSTHMATANASVLLFNSPTDTVNVATGESFVTSQATYEARIAMTSTQAGRGLVWNSYQWFYADKQLGCGPNGFWGFSAGLSHGGPPELTFSAAITRDEWHHIAYVYDGGEERLYLDGQLVQSRPATGSIRNWRSDVVSPPRKIEAVGSNYRRDGVAEARTPGFIGYIDWVRVSNVARYSGTSFCPPLAPPAPDGNCVLGYPFEEGPGSQIANDTCVGRGGFLGLPNGTGATRPDFVSDPIVAFPGDTDADCDTDLSDLAVLLTEFGSSGPGLAADFDRNCTIDLNDLAFLLSNFGLDC